MSQNTGGEYLCKSIYHGNSKVFISANIGRIAPVESPDRTEIDCGSDGKLKTFTDFNKVARITKELSLR